MSRRELADAVNRYLWERHQFSQSWDETDIGRLERGDNCWPNDLRREAFRNVLRVKNDHDLGFYIRRSTNATTGSARVPAPRTVDGEYSLTVEFSRAGTREVGNGEGDDWSSFAVVTSMLAQQRQAVPPGALLSLVEAHRECLLTLYRKAASERIGADIAALLSEASIVASRLWSAQGNHAMALAHCAYARTLADQLGNVRLGAIARIFESNLHSGASTLIQADGDIMTGLRLLDEAAKVACRLTAAAQARIAAEQAQAYAALGLRREAHAALERARRNASEITPQDRSGLFSDWDAARVQVYEGTCCLLLNEPAAAITHLEQAVAIHKDDQDNVNVALAARVDLAGAYALSGRLDAACSYLGDAYEHLYRIGNLRGISRARRAREGLNPWSNEPLVRELDERIRALDVGGGS